MTEEGVDFLLEWKSESIWKLDWIQKEKIGTNVVMTVERLQVSK